MKELIEEAKARVKEIVKKSKEKHPESYLAIYESENGYTIEWQRIEHDTRTDMIAFGRGAKTTKQVLQRIREEEEYEKDCQLRNKEEEYPEQDL